MNDSATSPFPGRLLAGMRHRVVPHALVVLLAWPVASVIFAVLLLREEPVNATVSTKVLVVGAAAGAARMLPEFLAGGALLAAASIILFSSIAALSAASPPLTHRWLLLAEPVLLFLAAFVGVAAEYPATLRHPLLMLFRSLSVTAVIVVLGALTVLAAIALGRRFGSPRRILLTLFVTVSVAAIAWRVSRPLTRSVARVSSARTDVLLGIDSLSQTDDVSILREAARRFGGTWYERPVPPGLLTNSVWPAILMDRTPRETGIFLVFQKPDWARAPFSIARRARQKGCTTFAFLETGFTAYVGRGAGFDRDRSGPQGWLQPATAAVKNGSLLLPVVLSRLPPIPGGVTPPNQTGAFNYDLRREIREILTSSSSQPCRFVASHLDYLHQTSFPAIHELMPEERSVVRATRSGDILDLSLEWQFPLLLVDPLRLYAWKVARIQRVIEEEVGATDFLDAGKENRLIVFSDHGNRRGITEANFGRPRYHRVLLATFGVPSRDPDAPISLLEIPAMLGLADPSRPRPAAPIVEYTNATGDEWRHLLESAHLRADGEISLNPAIVKEIGKRLLAYEPYAPKPEYSPAPTVTSSP